MQNCTSVIKAEAASLALASSIIKALNIANFNYFSDCQQLVQFLNMQDLANTPEWTIRPFTQVFCNNSATTSSRIIKINIRLNTTAHTLARQAYNSTILDFHNLCTHVTCDSQCSVMQALQYVDLPDVTIITARCG